jgi:hypothetical protein
MGSGGHDHPHPPAADADHGHDHPHPPAADADHGHDHPHPPAADADHGHDHPHPPAADADHGHDHPHPPAADADHGHDHPHPPAADADHGHTHDDGQVHEHDDHDHPHDHGSGLWASIKHTLTPHAHDHAEVIQSAEEASREGIRASWISLGGMAITAILQIGIVAISGSIALLADTVHNFGHLVTTIPLIIAFRLGRRPPNKRYPFGYRRAEDLVGLLIAGVIALSAAYIIWESIQAISNPRELDHLGCLPRLAAGGGPADAHEQPRPGGRPERPRTSSSTAGPAGRPAPGRRSTPSSASCAPSPTTRRSSSSRASRSASSGPTRGPRACSSRTRTSSPQWATWEHFRELEKAGLMMYGQMTAGSWIYIGTQGILQGTYETFAELARQHFGGSLRGRVVLTAGLGGMGGAQPLAVTMNDGVVLAIEVDPPGRGGGTRSATSTGSRTRRTPLWPGAPGGGPRRGALDRPHRQRRRDRAGRAGRRRVRRS